MKKTVLIFIIFLTVTELKANVIANLKATLLLNLISY